MRLTDADIEAEIASHKRVGLLSGYCDRCEEHWPCTAHSALVELQGWREIEAKYWARSCESPTWRLSDARATEGAGVRRSDD